MRILMFDIDTLRPDHLGCYGYKRNTSPTIDSIAKEGVTFTNYFCPNAPCLPSRASLLSGQYGIRTGVVGHGGTSADMRLQGETRGFTSDFSEHNLFMQFRNNDMHTVSFSSFPERHSSWWFNSGLNECHNNGKRGHESAEVITPKVLDWIEKNGEQDNWFMHVHYWDPHTPYRAPADFGNPFENEPLSNDWITKEVFDEHLLHIGPHSVNEISMWDSNPNPEYPRHPGSLSSHLDAKKFIDEYDCGIKYTDDNIKQIVDLIKAKGLYTDDLAIIITSDHGENMGELGIYGEHGTADAATCKIPMIIKWPNAKKGTTYDGLHDNVDLLPTIRELLSPTEIEERYEYDGVSYASSLLSDEDNSKENLVLTQCAHVCQRSAIFDNYLYIRTIHGGYHTFPKEMLFDIKNDPFEQNNIAKSHPELCAKGAKIILDWTDEMMEKSSFDADPLWTVMRENGPQHCKDELALYLERIRGTNREFGIEKLAEIYPRDFKKYNIK